MLVFELEIIQVVVPQAPMPHHAQVGRWVGWGVSVEIGYL